MFRWRKKRREDHGAWLAFNIAIKSGNACRAFEIAKNYSVKYPQERISEAYNAIHTSGMSNKDKAAQLVCLMDPFWKAFGIPVFDEWVTAILKLDPTARYHVTMRRMNGNARLDLIEQMLDEGQEFPHNIRMALSNSVESLIRVERQDKLLVRLVVYALEHDDIETAYEAGMLINDSKQMPEDSWRTLITKVIAALSSDKAVALARVAQGSFFPS